jgi:uncharacterized protein YbjT (DUF2867 family)
VIVLSRSGTAPSLPASVTVRKVDYDSVESLTTAIKGADALVSAVGFGGLVGQKKIVDAAVAAGVQRIIPSEFGQNTTLPEFRTLPVFSPKIELQEYLKKVHAESGVTYTVVATGPFLDWGLEEPYRFLLGSLKERKVEIYDGGDKLFSATTVADVGKGVAGILRHPEETKNRAVCFESAVVSQNQILRIAQQLTPGVEWSVTQSSTDEVREKVLAKYASGGFDEEVVVLMIKVSIFNAGFPTAFKQTDNDLVGIKVISDEELKSIVKSNL